MTPEFQDIRSAVGASDRLVGEEQGARRQRLRRSRETFLDGVDGSLPLPSLRAETGALLERQLLISGGLEAGRLPRVPGDRRSRLTRLILFLCLLAPLGAVSGLYIHYQKAKEEWRDRLSAQSREIAVARADNERLLRDNEATALRLREVTGELARESGEKQRIAREADRMLGELRDARKDLRSLQSQIGDLNDRYRKLEAGRLSELGAFFRKSLLRPIERLRFMSGAGAVTSGPVPKTVVPKDENGTRTPFE